MIIILFKKRDGTKYDQSLFFYLLKTNQRKCSGPKPLDGREWICPNCKTYHDCDINATVNIFNCGLASTK